MTNESLFLLSSISIDKANREISGLPKLVYCVFWGFSGFSLIWSNHQDFLQYINYFFRFEFQELHLSNNSIVKLPAAITSLSELEILDISNNKIDEIEHIRDLKKLRSLNISENANLKKIPNQLATCFNLTEFIFDANNIIYPENDILILDIKNILKYLAKEGNINLESIDADLLKFEEEGEEVSRVDWKNIGFASTILQSNFRVCQTQRKKLWSHEKEHTKKRQCIFKTKSKRK